MHSRTADFYTETNEINLPNGSVMFITIFRALGFGCVWLHSFYIQWQVTLDAVKRERDICSLCERLYAAKRRMRILFEPRLWMRRVCVGFKRRSSFCADVIQLFCRNSCKLGFV